jgi:predicted aldo/keto reductase-like oxidoreductase
MSAGMKYFDTAFVYGAGASERAAKEALVDRYPRESFLLATKLNAWMMCDGEESAKQQFFTSLERTGAGYFDFYLMHAMRPETYEKYERYHIWEFLREQKEKGLIRHYGFSFHAGPDLLDKLLTEHPETEFVQLQLNYADWDSPAIRSRENYEMARKHGKPIVVMEPVKGGILAAPPQGAAEVFRAAAPDASPASWAVRFAASLPGVMTVLSGMSNVAQMEDNLSYMKDFAPFTEAELAVVARAQEELAKIDSIPCTNCQYCMPGCPKGIPIPYIFSAMNKIMQYDRLDAAKNEYAFRTENGKVRASHCVQCGACEKACPQSLPIRELLKKCAAVFDA